jgi:transposase-like protein
MRTKCKFCRSDKLVRHGKANGYQRYLCKTCNHKFCDNGNQLVRMRTQTHIVVAALNMYFDGLSVRKVSRQLNELFGEKSTQVTVWNWIQKYSQLVSDYVKTLEPNLSGKYHHDETEIRVDAGGRYFWETIDEDTRFIVAHLLSNGRSTKNATEVFRQALSKQRPNALFTDGSYAYDTAFNKVFYSRFKTNRVEWVKRVGIGARETNNIVERLHQTLKDRTKVMRGLKNDKTASTLLDGYVAYYNFCREHQAIGKTPAQAAGLKVRGWRELIENAQELKTLGENQNDDDSNNTIQVKEVKVKT